MPTGDAPATAAAAPAAADISDQDEVQPIFARRWVACHGCLGSPCNLNLVPLRLKLAGA
jgi:hypothetical protein